MVGGVGGMPLLCIVHANGALLIADEVGVGKTIEAALDLAIASTRTAAWSTAYSVIDAAWWFREHLLFIYHNVTIELTRIDEMGAISVEVP